MVQVLILDTSFHTKFPVDKEWYSVITTLLECGANPNLKGQNDYSPLHQAIAGGLVDTAKALIAYGADINSQGPSGNTPLHLARSIETIKLLLDEGAKTTIINIYELPPLKASLMNFKKRNKGAVKTLKKMFNNYIDKPRSLKLLHVVAFVSGW